MRSFTTLDLLDGMLAMKIATMAAIAATTTTKDSFEFEMSKTELGG